VESRLIAYQLSAHLLPSGLILPAFARMNNRLFFSGLQSRSHFLLVHYLTIAQDKWETFFPFCPLLYGKPASQTLGLSPNSLE